MFKRFIIPIMLIAIVGSASLKAQKESECRECPLPKLPNNTTLKDSVMDVYFKDNRPPIYDVLSVKRDSRMKLGRMEQTLKLKIRRNGTCIDTIISLKEAEKLSVSGLGLGGQTLDVPVYPAREYYRETGFTPIKDNFLEITGNYGYFGTDNSKQKVGVSSSIFGFQALWAPFREVLSRSVKLAFGAGAIFENSRMRIPVMIHLRHTFSGSEHSEEYYKYVPSPCRFGREGDAPITADDKSFIEVPADGRIDSTVYYYRDIRLIKSEFRPFLFLEGGIFFNGSYTGAGSKPSYNPEEYGQYFVGVGAGLPFWNYFTASLSFRFMRTNLRTPCETCPDDYKVNSDKSYGININLGWRLEY